MALASLGTGVLCTFGASWHVGFWRTFSVSIRNYITNLYHFILRLRISSSMEGVRSTHGKQAEQICWQDWWLSFRDVDCQPFIRRKIWSSFGSVVKIIKSVKPNNEEKTSSSAFIREPEVPATLALHPFRMWSTHKTEMLRCLHETYIRLTSNIFKAYQTNLHCPILRLESAGKVGAPVLGERFARMFPQLVTSKNVATTKQHFRSF